MDVITSKRRDFVTSYQFCSHLTIPLCYAHVSTKFEVYQPKNTITMAKKHPKLTFLRHNVATSLRHNVRSHMVRCAYDMSMSPPNLKLIGQKTRSQWPKNRQNGRFYAITSRRRYVMMPIPTWYTAPIPCPCLHQIWSKSVEKHGHSGQKTAKMDVFTS